MCRDSARIMRVPIKDENPRTSVGTKIYNGQFYIVQGLVRVEGGFLQSAKPKVGVLC